MGHLKSNDKASDTLILLEHTQNKIASNRTDNIRTPLGISKQELKLSHIIYKKF